MNITLTYYNPNNLLSREEYHFYVNDAHYQIEIVLNRYYKQSLPTKKHRNWNNDLHYDRLNVRNNNVTVEQVPLSEKIKNDAIEELIKKTVVLK